jgi:hypothetical protein
MFTVIVNYELAPSLSLEKVRQYYEQAVPKFEHMPGLIRKYFMLSEDGRIGGSVYLWETRDQAISFHDESWKEFMRGKYGNRPQVTIFECPIIVDNVLGDVIIN